MKEFWYNVRKHIVIYVIAIVLVPLAVSLGCELRTKTPKKALFGVMISSDEIDSSEIVSSLGSALNKEGIEEFRLYNDSPVKDATMYDDQLSAKGVALSDLMIVPESKCDSAFVAYNCVSFIGTYENGLTFNGGEAVYGLKVYDKETKTSGLSDIIDFELTDENYYLTISKNSYHYSAYSNGKNDILKDAIDWFVNYEKE